MNVTLALTGWSQSDTLLVIAHEVFQPLLLGGADAITYVLLLNRIIVHQVGVVMGFLLSLSDRVDVNGHGLTAAESLRRP